jgi:hypothetical protein
MPIVTDESMVSRAVNYVYSWFPSTDAAGRGVGTALCLVHASEMSNRMVEEVLPYLGNKAFHLVTGLELPSGEGYVASKAKKVVLEAAKLAATPMLVQAATALVPPAAGLTLSGMVAITCWLYHKAIPNNAKEPLQTVSTLDEAFKVTEEGKILDINSKAISKAELKSVIKWVSRYDLACKLYDAKIEDIDDIFKSFMGPIHTETGGTETTYVDKWGKPLEKKDIKIIKQARNLLKEENATKDFEEIGKAIELLADSKSNVSMKELKKSMKGLNTRQQELLQAAKDSKEQDLPDNIVTTKDIDGIEFVVV